jgi:hypothetical protein
MLCVAATVLLDAVAVMCNTVTASSQQSPDRLLVTLHSLSMCATLKRLFTCSDSLIFQLGNVNDV